MLDSTTERFAGTVAPAAPPASARVNLRVALTRAGKVAGQATALPLLVALLYVLAARGVAGRYGPPQINLWGWVPPLAVFATYGFVLSLAWRRFTGQPHAVSAALRDAPTALALQLAVAPVLAAHSEYKIVMQQIQPFFLDPVLLQADWLLHLGRHPFQLIPSWPALTRLMDEAYIAWFTVVFLSVTAAAWLSAGRQRARIFLAFFMCWALLGAILATLLSSAGPVYLERMGLSTAYVPLTDYLRGLDVLAVAGHESLWLGYIGQASPTGISAMPSMHVAIPALFTIAAWRYRWLRWLGLTFTGIILVGSVHLAWHYALDGYVAIAAVLCIWWLAGVLVDRVSRPRSA